MRGWVDIRFGRSAQDEVGRQVGVRNAEVGNPGVERRPCGLLSPFLTSAFRLSDDVKMGKAERCFWKFRLCGLVSLNVTSGFGRITGRTVPSGDRYPIFPRTELVLLMKSQKRSRLFRALLCSSAAVTAVSSAFGQDGVTRVSSQPPTPDPMGSDGVASTATPDGGVAQVPTYALPDYIPPSNSQGYNVPTRTVWQDELGPRFLLETRIGEWLGSTGDGESAVNVMLPFTFENSTSLAFLDARGTVSWDGGGSGSVGGGLRWYDEFRNRITGVSGFWDYDDGNENSYDQVGVSFESRGKWVSVHANGYFALGDETNVLNTRLTGALVPGTPITATAMQGIETAYSGFNVEVGGPTPLLGKYGFESFVGGYYFDTPDAEEAAGVSFRTDVNLSNDLQLGINVTDDAAFGTQVFGTVVLQLPGGRPKEFFRPRKVVDRVLDRVERRYRVTTNRTVRTVQVPVTTLSIPAMGATGGAGTAINNVIVVDPNASTNGTGSFDDPFNTFLGIPNPSPNTLTLVRSGSVQGQYNLAGDSLLLSEQFLNQQIVMMTTPLGAFRFPGLNAAATTPVWSNTAGNAPGTSIVNILGDNTEVAGFIFDGRTTTGVSNSIIQASGVQGVSIHDNTFRNYRNAVNLQNITGTVATGNPTSIYSNAFLGSSGQSFNGFMLENNGIGTLDLELGATEFNVVASSGSAQGNFASGNAGEDVNGNGMLDAGEDTNGNLVLDTGAGFSVTARNRAVINARIVGNFAASESDANGDGSLNSEDVNANGVLDPGEDLNGNGALDFGDDLNRNGRFDTGNGTGFVINAGATQSTINLTMRDNTADRNIGDGVFLAANSSVLNAGQLGEDVNGNGRLDTEDLNRNGLLDGPEDINGNGILDLSEDANGNGVLDAGEDTNGNGRLDLSEDVNSNGRLDIGEDTVEDINGNGRLDVSEDLNGNGILDVGEDRDGNGVLTADEDLNGNRILDAGEDANGNGVLDTFEDFNGDGRLALGNGNGQLDLGEDRNEDANGNGVLDPGEDRNGDGYLNRGDGDGNLDGGFIIVGNNITRNGRDGIRVDSTNNSNVDLRLVGNFIGSQFDRATGNQGIGLNVAADSGSIDLDMGFLYFEDVNFNNVLDPGEDTNGNGRLDSPLSSNANQVIGNFGGGVNFGLTGTATGRIAAIGNSIQGTGGGALVFDIAGGVDTATTPFNFINRSVSGVDITRLVWNLAPAAAQVDGSNTQSTILNGTDVLTGLQSVNGNAGAAAIPNLATTVDLIFNSFNAANGLLDAGEDRVINVDSDGDGILDSTNGMLDLGEDLDTFTLSVDIDLANGTDVVTAADLLNSRVDVTFSTGQRVTGLLQADPANAANVTFTPDGTTLPQSTGLAISTAGNSVLQPSTIFGNQIQNFGGNGISVRSTDEGNIQNLLVRANTITGNFGIGANFETSSALNAQMTVSMINNDLAESTQGGIVATATGGTLTFNDIQGNILDGGGSGIQLSGSQSGILSARITNNAISNSMIMDGSTGNGVDITADGATVTLLELANNTINTNAGTGVTLRAINSGSMIIPDSEDLNGNGVLDPGEDANEDLNGNGILDAGEDVNADGLLNVGNGNGRLDRGITTNSINNNAGDSFRVVASASSTAVPATVRLGNVTGNQILFNTAGTGGFTVNGINANITGSFTNNIVTGSPTANPTAGPGFLVSTSGGSFNVAVGGPNAADGNVISQTRGAGIAFVMTDTGTGALTIQNNLITSIADDFLIEDLNQNGQLDPGEDVDGDGIFDFDTTPFQGDGISISLVSSNAVASATAVLTRSEISDNTIGDVNNPNLGTAGSGVSVLLSENTAIQDLLIARNVIGSPGNDNTNARASIDDAGIEIDRLDDSRLDAVNPRTGDLRAIVIDGNTVRGTFDPTLGSAVAVDGLFINVMNGIRDDIDFDVRNNIFANNSGEGVHLNTQGDASLSVDMRGNLIEGNGLNGIHMTGVEIVATDLETQGGTWIQNVIRNNVLSGIQIDGVSGTVIPLIIGQNGADPFTGESLGNIITGNGGDGIEINSGGAVQINNNNISRNSGAGIDINSNFIGIRTALLQNNAITENRGDGLEIQSRGSSGVTLVALGNAIDNNFGRGVDLLNQGAGVFSGFANLKFGDGTAAGMNRISSNGEEGFYVVTTAAGAQTQDQRTSVAYNPTAADGSTGLVVAAANEDGNDPDTVLDLDRNIISSNNNRNAFDVNNPTLPNTNPFPGGGLVLRVGSTNSFNNAGAATIVADTTGDNTGGFGSLTPIGVGSNSATLGNGRMNARIVNNTFEGNLGDDVFIQSFTSTDVGSLTGTNGTWNDMVFTVMAYESDPLARLNLVFRGNTGNSLNVTNVGAFYNDGDGAFKSRTIMMAPQPTGPFQNAGRRRNAQRVPARGDILNQLAPLNGPDNGAFQYPGMGASTFRIESDFDVSGFQSGDTFFLDGTPIPPIFNANGIFRAGQDEMPYGWGTAAPGTFQFDEAFLGVAP